MRLAAVILSALGLFGLSACSSDAPTLIGKDTDVRTSQPTTNLGKQSTCRDDFNTVQTAVEAYFVKNGTYPAAETSEARIALLIPDFLRKAPSSADYTISLDAAGAVAASPPCTVP